MHPRADLSVGEPRRCQLEHALLLGGEDVDAFASGDQSVKLARDLYRVEPTRGRLTPLRDLDQRGLQLLDTSRLSHVPGGTCRQGTPNDLLAEITAEHHHRHLWMLVAQPSAELVARYVWKPEVDHGDVRPEFARQRCRSVGPPGGAHDVESSVGRQRCDQSLAYDLVVVDDKYLDHTPPQSRIPTTSRLPCSDTSEVADTTSRGRRSNPASRRDDLCALAELAKAALSAEGVAISGHRVGDPATWTVRGTHVRMVDDLAFTDWIESLDGADESFALDETDGGALPRLLPDAEGRTVLAARVVIDDRFVGVVVAAAGPSHALTNTELALTFARHAAAQIALADDQAHDDFLDGLDLSPAEPADFVRDLCAAVGAAFESGLTGVMVHDEREQVLRMLPGSFGATDDLTASYQIRADNPHSNAARVFTTGHPYLNNRVRADPGILPDYVDAFGINRTLSLRLDLAGRPIGVLHIANKRQPYTSDDLKAAVALAPRVASAVELFRNMVELRHQQKVEGILARLAVAIASGESAQHSLPESLSRLCSAIDASAIALTLGGVSPIVATAAGSRVAASIEELASSRELPSPLVLRPRQPGDPGSVIVQRPVQFGGEDVGRITALRERGEMFRPFEQDALSRVAGLTALAYTTERYQQYRAEVARLQERDRIADNLHDEVAQTLFAAQMVLDRLIEEGDGARTGQTEALVQVRRLLVRGDAAIRAAIHELTPAGSADLARRLADVVADIESTYGLAIHLGVSDRAAKWRPDRSVAEAVLKIAREALVNSAKHGGPCRIAVSIDVDATGGCRLTVVDDGFGSSPGELTRGHGLQSLQRAVERVGGTIDVRPGRRGGVSLIAAIPA